MIGEAKWETPVNWVGEASRVNFHVGNVMVLCFKIETELLFENSVVCETSMRGMGISNENCGRDRQRQFHPIWLVGVVNTKRKTNEKQTANTYCAAAVPRPWSWTLLWSCWVQAMRTGRALSQTKSVATDCPTQQS